ncbi:MAG: S41 family peptidase [Candidatus Uhrbacteria bacterium]
MENHSSFKKRRGWLSATIPLVFLFGVGVAFTVGLLFGRHQGVLSVVPDGEGRVVNHDQQAALDKNLDFGLFWDVWNFSKENFYQAPVSDQALFYGSMKGMVAGLDDPYSVFFDPEEAKQFKEDLTGSFEGIGAEIGMKDDQITIVAPLPGSPAETAGLLSGDKILAVDGNDVSTLSVEEVVTKIRGPGGTIVTLTITRDGLGESFDIPITRDKIVIDSLKLEMRDDGIAVIHLYIFNEDTVGLFTAAINDLLTKGAKGIVLDLRGDPGGVLDAAIKVASAWTGQQTVVIQSAHDSKQSYVGPADARLVGIPTVVLVDGGSASASEIVSGALQDYGLATLVGTQTFGKGSVQDYRELDGGSAMKITTAEWLTPKERSINHVGITPDFIVEYTIDDAKAERDPQMDKAIELLSVAQGD